MIDVKDLVSAIGIQQQQQHIDEYSGFLQQLNP